MTRNKRMLLGATASVALMGGAPAFAFEEVDWTWDATVTETIDINATIDVALDPNGLVQVEKLQMHFGDLSSEAHVNGVANNPATGGGTVDIDETFDFATIYDDGEDPAPIIPAAGTPLGSSGLSANLLDGGELTEGPDTLDFQIQVTGTVDVPADNAIDAADLPKVSNSATSVANNQSIEADVPIFLHDAQFAAGDFNPTCGGGGEVGASSNYGCPDALGFLIGAYGVTVLDGQLEDINEHTSIAALMTVAAATGFIEPANISANASVSNVLNAYVENAATAVTNNASFEVLSDNPANHAIVADLTQWGYANLTANANVTNVVLNDYTGFGAAGLGGGGEDVTPIVSNAATAVGNNLSIKVGVPDV